MINKNIIALGFVSFFTDMASSMVTSILPIFIVYTLHEGVDKLGFVVAIATFISYAFRILFGYLSDRYQVVKPFVVTGVLYLCCDQATALCEWFLAECGDFTWGGESGKGCAFCD